MLLIFVGDVTVISWNSRTPEKGSSLKWQLSHTHSRALREFFMIRIAFRMEHCKCTKLFQWIHINFLEFIRTVLLHRSQVDDRKRSDFGFVCWLSRLAGPGFVSMSPDSISLCVEELLLCVCVCVFTSIHLEGFIHLGLEVQGTDQRCCVEDVIFLCQVPSLILQYESPSLSN